MIYLENENNFKEKKEESTQINFKQEEDFSAEVFSEEFLAALLSNALEDFPAIWKELKEEIKNLSEEEKIQRIFEAGALAVLEQLQEKEDLEEDDSEEEEF